MKIFISVILLFSQIGLSFAESYKERFEKLKGKNPKQAEELFSKWQKAEPKNADVLVLKASYYLEKARKVTPPPPGKDTGKGPDKSSVKDKAKSADKGPDSNQAPPENMQPPPKVTYDPKLAKTALGAYDNALKMAPDRLDIYFGIAFVNQELGNFDAQYKNLQTALKMLKEKPKAVKWQGGKKLEKADEVISKIMLEFMEYYQFGGSKDDDEKFLKIAKLTLDSFPNDVVSLNGLGGYYLVKKDLKNALTYLKKAHGINSSDCIVMGNLAGVYMAQNDQNSAKSTLKKMVSSCKNPEIVKQAKSDLKELEKTKKGK